jgi:hypothetical protein
VAANVVRFQSPKTINAPAQAVYMKDRWDDEWQLVPELWATEANWNTAPTIPTASIRYAYGDIKYPNSPTFQTWEPLNNQLRVYVKVVYYPVAAGVSDDEETEQVPLEWIGVIDNELDEQLAPDLEWDEDTITAYPRGRNHFVAYGIISLLAQSWIDRSVFLGEGQQETFVGRGLTFNVGLASFNPDPGETTGEGNRSTTTGASGAYVFHGLRTGGSIWTTRNIVDYLLTYCVVRDYADEQRVPFELINFEVLPDWDEPIQSTDGLTVYDVLLALVSRHRGYTFWAEVDEQGTVGIYCATFLTDDITLDAQKTIPKNPNQVTLAYETDRDALAVVSRSSQEAVDQVVVQGERRTSTATFSYADGTLDNGWTSSLESAYETAASSSGDYPAAGDVEQREAFNIACRSADKFRPVFARFVMPDPTTEVGDGTGAGTMVPLMPSDDDPESSAPHAPDDRRFLPYLALLEGYVYDGDAIDGGNPTETGLKPHRHLPPLVLFPRPKLDDLDPKTRYRHADASSVWARLAIAFERETAYPWSANVRIDDDDGALWVQLQDGYQHIIAKTDFTPLADDPAFNVADYKDMLATLSVPWSFFAEGKYPEDAPEDQDIVRRMLIKAPYRRLDYVAPNTVVAINEQTGELLRSDTGGFVRDDREELSQIARVAYSWYGTARKSVSFSTALINSTLALGDLVVSIGDPLYAGNIVTEDVNSIITSIRIVSPLAESEGDVTPLPPRIEYQTAFGELDALSLLPRIRQR